MWAIWGVGIRQRRKQTHLSQWQLSCGTAPQTRVAQARPLKRHDDAAERAGGCEAGKARAGHPGGPRMQQHGPPAGRGSEAAKVWQRACAGGDGGASGMFALGRRGSCAAAGAAAAACRPARVRALALVLVVALLVTGRPCAAGSGEEVSVSKHFPAQH
eukprot:359093-Chlamydomonas_euryale.AAC.3